MKKKEKRKKLWLDTEIHEKIKSAAAQNNRKMIDEIRERFKV